VEDVHRLLQLPAHRRYHRREDLHDARRFGASGHAKVVTSADGQSPDLQSMEQIRRVMRPTDVPDTGLLCDLLWSDPDKDITGWSENDRGVSFTFGPDVVSRFLQKHDMDLICRAHQVSPQGYGCGTEKC